MGCRRIGSGTGRRKLDSQLNSKKIRNKDSLLNLVSPYYRFNIWRKE
jgi:hypothetical protein